MSSSLTKFHLLRVASLLFCWFEYASTQGPIAFEDICQREQGVSDNLSCPRADGVLQCYSRSELCDGSSFCDDGFDEGFNLNALDCDGSFTGRVTEPIAAFICSSMVVVELDQLCDGVDDCGNGADETTALCENKCLAPYYGNCSYTRECISSDLDVMCGLCRPGFAENPANIDGECLSATFQFSPASYSVIENAGLLAGSVTLNTAGLIDQEILVVVQTDGTGTAVVGVDYTALVATLTYPVFSAGDTQVGFTVPIIDDLISEGSESFGLSASIVNNQGVFSAGGDNALVTVIDDEPAPVVECPPLPSITNGGVSYAPDNVANYALGTVATYFCFVGFSLELSNGGSEMRTCVDDNDGDAEGEFDRQAPTCTPAVVFSFQFALSSYVVDENDLLLSGAILLDTTGVLDQDVVITVQTVDGTATAGLDYSPITTSLTFPQFSGRGTLAQFNVSILDDIICEDSETFTLSASTDSVLGVFNAGNTANITITDDDSVSVRLIPPLGRSVPSYLTPETRSPLEVCVEILRPSNQSVLETTISLTFSTMSAMAMSPVDYGAVNQVIVFTPQTQGDVMCIDININDDVICEVDEVFTVSVIPSEPDCITVEPGFGEGTVTIFDDDIVTIGPDQGIVNYNVTERLDNATWISLRLTGFKDSGRQCEVFVRTADETATAGMDYIGLTTTLIFNNTSDFHILHIDILDDLICEGHERFLVFLNTMSSGCDIVDGALRIWIWDDEVHFAANITVSIEEESYTVTEGETLEVCVVVASGELTRDLNVDLAIPLQLMPLTLSANLTLAPSTLRSCAFFPFPNDNVASGPSMLAITASLPNSDSGVVLDRSTASLLLLDNDDQVEISFLPDLYSVVEGGVLEVCVFAVNEGGTNVSVDGQIIIAELNIISNFSFESISSSSMKFTQSISIPDDDILNAMAERRAPIMLTSTSSNVTVAAQQLRSNDIVRLDIALREGTWTSDAFSQDSARQFVEVRGREQDANIIIVDDEIVQIGFQEAQFTFIEGEGPAHICVQLMQGSGCRRPVVVRIHTMECPDGENPADEGSDFEAVWEIVSVNVNAEEGDLFCFYVDLVDNDEIEFNETFKVTLEMFDINAYVPFDSRVAIITIIDDDNVTVEPPPFAIQFDDNTPEVTGSEVRVSFSSTRLLSSAMCGISFQNSVNCEINGTSGSIVFNRVTRVAPYTISIAAVATNGQQASLSRTVRSETTGQCSAHLINEGIIINNVTRTVEFQISIIGPSPDNRVTETTCVLDSGPQNPCPEPLEFPTNVGDHILSVRPLDPDDICRRRQALVISYTV